MNSKIKMFLSCLFLGFLLSCHSAKHEIDAKILNAFSDFAFVGTGQAKYKEDGSLDRTYVPAHGQSEQPMPQNLENGVEYIFHRRIDADSESLALRDMPERISRLGFKILYAPKSSEDMLYLVIGGPIFHIKFSDGDHEGIIFNQIETTDTDIWTGDDYVLVYTR